MAVIEQVIQEGRLTFNFPEDALASKYDDWTHYRRQFNPAFGGTKAVDLVFVDDATGWLIELKDYREYRRTKTIDLADEVAAKVRDTLAGMISAKLHAADTDERRLAKAFLRCNRIRVVLHLEQPEKHSKLRPRAIDPAAVLLKLKGLVKSVDPHPCVVDKSSLKGEMKWVVEG
ncbi:hypothetical protein [Pseudomonas laurylsulfatiphila]|uniref:hypothetical protein n=1 Tax=Pseudomonas laurylsulfatiphila TaxID=2011015 RepID=UPI003D0EB99D